LIALLAATSTISSKAAGEEADYIEYDPSAPKWLPYDEDVPPGYVASSRIRLGWLITGASTLAGSYAYTLAVYALVSTSTPKDDGILFLPGVGPLIFAAREGRHGSPFVVATLVIDGLLQMTAVAVAIWAATDSRKLLIRADLAVAPLLMEGGGGVGVTTRF